MKKMQKRRINECVISYKEKVCVFENLHRMIVKHKLKYLE